MIEAIGILLLIILAFAGVLADILIIYTLLRFKRLRSPFNVFLANWAIADLLSIILVPITYTLVFSTQLTTEFICILVQAALILHVTEILFGIVLCIDWCLAAYFQSLSEIFRRYYRYVNAAIWVLTLLFYSIITALCISDFQVSHNMILFGIVYAISVIFVISLQCSTIIQKCKRFPVSYPKPLPLRLTLITTIIFSYLLAVVNMILTYLEIYHLMYDYTFICTVVSACAIISTSIVTLMLLCWLNYDFRQCLFQLKKRVRQEQFDNEVSEAEDATKNTPEFTFHTSTQDIVTENGYRDLVS